MSDGEGCSVVIVVAFLMFIAGFGLGGASAQRSHEKMLVEKGFAHYDQKTREFTLHEPCHDDQ